MEPFDIDYATQPSNNPNNPNNASSDYVTKFINSSNAKKVCFLVVLGRCITHCVCVCVCVQSKSFKISKFANFIIINILLSVIVIYHGILSVNFSIDSCKWLLR